MKTYQVSDEIEILDNNDENDEPYVVNAIRSYEAAEAYAKETDDEIYDGSEAKLYVQELGKPETRLVFLVTTYVKVTYMTRKLGIA